MLHKWQMGMLYLDVLLAVAGSLALLFVFGQTPAASTAHFYTATFARTTLPSVAHAGDANPTHTIVLSSFLTESTQSIAVVSSFSLSISARAVQPTNIPVALLDCTLLLDTDLLGSVHDAWTTYPESQTIVLAGVDMFPQGVHTLQLSCHAYSRTKALVLTSLGTVMTVD